MNAYVNFSRSWGFLVLFLVMTLIVDLIFGDKVTGVFLSLILLNMVMVNIDLVTSIMNYFKGV